MVLGNQLEKGLPYLPESNNDDFLSVFVVATVIVIVIHGSLLSSRKNDSFAARAAIGLPAECCERP
jgi:hypothetical protein